MEYENNKIQVELEKKQACQAHAKITISPQMAADNHAKALKNIRKGVSLPVFRKGRVPVNMIEQRYGNEIQREFLRMTTDEAIQEAFELTKTYPFSRQQKIQIDPPKIDEKEGGELVARYEYYPDVPQVNPENVKLEKTEPDSVSETMLKDQMIHVRLNSTELTEVEERPIAEGDIVAIEIHGKGDSDYSLYKKFLLLPGEVEGWILKAVKGKSKHETITGVKRAKETFDPQMPKEVDLIIMDILSGEVPPFDDALAETYKLKDEQELRNEIQKQMEKQEEQRALQQMREATREALIASYHFEIPESILKSETQYRTDEMLQAITNDEEKKDKKEEIEKSAVIEAEQSLRLQFLLTNLADQENLFPDQAEINLRLISLLMKSGLAHQQDLDTKRLQAQVRHNLTMENALDFIIDSVLGTSEK